MMCSILVATATQARCPLAMRTAGVNLECGGRAEMCARDLCSECVCDISAVSLDAGPYKLYVFFGVMVACQDKTWRVVRGKGEGSFI